MVLHELASSGEFDAHLSRIRGAYQARREALLHAIATHFPPEIEVTRPTGGITLWVKLHPTQSVGEVVERARQRGVLVADGRLFLPDGEESRGFRICYATVKEAAIEKGIAVLGSILKETLRVGRTLSRHAGPLV
jgi:2-aminoadipate transaminase